MPEMDGLTCTEEIRKHEVIEGLQRIPIVALTANAFPDFMQRCLDSGMDDFLSKPVNLKCLKEKLSKWLTKPKPFSSL